MRERLGNSSVHSHCQKKKHENSDESEHSNNEKNCYYFVAKKRIVANTAHMKANTSESNRHS